MMQSDCIRMVPQHFTMKKVVIGYFIIINSSIGRNVKHLISISSVIG